MKIKPFENFLLYGNIAIHVTHTCKIITMHVASVYSIRGNESQLGSKILLKQFITSLITLEEICEIWGEISPNITAVKTLHAY